MEPKHRETIQKNLIRLSTKVTNLEQLYAELLGQRIIFPNDVEKLKKSYPIQQEQALEFFLRYTKRGPQAFGVLIAALRKIGNVDEANALAVGSNNVVNVDEESQDQSNTGCGAPEGASGSGSLWRPHSATVLPQSSPVALRQRANSTSRILGQLNRARAFTMESLPPLNIKLQLKKATLYNMGVHDAYPMMSNPRGNVLIINNIDFMGNPLANRTGAEKDTENLRQLFESLHFKVTSYHNVKKQALFAPSEGIIDTFLNEFSNEDCCIVAIMSHGTEGYFQTVDSEHSTNSSKNRVSIWKELLPKFNNRHCPKLRNKPKIFIIQSCRGEIRDRGVRRNQTDSARSTLSSSPTSPEQHLNQATEGEQDEYGGIVNQDQVHDRLPSFEDMIICQSTVPGFVSNRDIEKGTWYIESICRVLSTYAHEMELTKMLKKVGLLMRSISSEYGEKQMCSYLDAGFHYDIYFNPGLFAENNTSNTMDNWSESEAPET